MSDIYIRKLHLTPPQIIALGFAVVIAIGTILLTSPSATVDGEGLSFVDALFTATSATAVTGLIVVDTGTYLTSFGQVVVLFMIQIGGLGFMTMSTLFALALGKKISLKERLLMQEALNQVTFAGIVKLTKYILIFTVIVESAAALILTTCWIGDLGLRKSLYYGVFHAISAFNNAGFDLFSVSLVNYKGDILVNFVIISLFVGAGLGFTVWADVYTNGINNWRKFSLHTKLVLLTTTVLIIVGFFVVLILENSNSSTLGSLSIKDKLLTAMFQGVTTRTAGFNTIPIGNLRPSTLFFMIVFMFIGASPGSTGGGVKTTTFSSLIAGVIAIIRGRNEVVLFERRLPHELILKSLAVITISSLLVFFVTSILLITENAPFEAVLFEVTSAFATVGLSTGLTPNLSIIGKILITFTMFIGRVGPLTIAFAITQRQQKTTIRYPEEKIIVG